MLPLQIVRQTLGSLTQIHLATGANIATIRGPHYLQGILHTTFQTLNN